MRKKITPESAAKILQNGGKNIVLGNGHRVKWVNLENNSCYAEKENSGSTYWNEDVNFYEEVYNEQQCVIHDVSNSVDFWKDAQEFLKSQLPDDFQEKLNSYVTKKGYNSNECRLFKSMLTEAVGLYGTVMVIKHCG